MAATIFIVFALVLAKHGWTESFRGHHDASFVSRMKCYHRCAISSKSTFLFSQSHHHNYHQQQFPIPAMPSDNFRKMAQSQLELLASSLTTTDNPSVSKVQSMILYLPQENSYSGQLEFTPAILYPDPSTERVFIASDAESGQAPTLPKSLSKLPGFSSAPDLLPGYPMLAGGTDPGVGSVEEVLCDIRFKTSALSIPLLSGVETVGVLLVSPTVPFGNNNGNNNVDLWTKRDKEQVSLAAQSLSMALRMDNERNILREQNDIFRENLSDSLHQMKNPIQALRTYGKILQRQIAETSTDVGGTSQLLELAERLMVQSDRVVDMLGPMDSLVENLDPPNSLVMLPPATTNNTSTEQSMVLWNLRPQSNSAIVPQTDQQVIVDKNDTQTLDLKQAGYENSEQSETRGLKTTLIGDFEPEMVFITDVLEPVFDTFKAIASEEGILFEILIEDIDDLPGVFVAPKSFQEAASNVLDNAFKYVVLPKPYSPFTRNPSPQVRVRIYPSDHSERPGLIVLVEDNGPGITTDDRDLIFQRGFRSNRTSSEIGGRGIGLGLAKALMERMGGYLSIATDEETSQFSDRLDGAMMKLEVSRKPYIISQ
eukprot:CAMPEP_0172397542 /NCGR_PEP_ID=MMETSP1061-20121228/31147_1 /TAXON_ID=37318 /ORGANISM="Pseudo-nitzschia pungens, Strain cf. pungens" /LENGTH=596 /DNA_ID=CAMNT_0013129755 /DNA_START=75 /DNA_END=1865 /DNA_ORIENTATION=-